MKRVLVKGVGVGAALLLGSATVAAGATPVTTTNMQTVGETSKKPVQFSVSIGAGYLTGDSTELVYWPEQGNHKASELRWKIDDLFMIGVKGKMQIGSRVALKLDGWFKATDGSGTMDDYDWQVVGFSEWTDWSHHDNTDVTEGSIIDTSAEFTAIQHQNFDLNGIVGFRRDHFGWEARGGNYTYSVNGFRDTVGSFSNDVTVIGYDQTFTSLYLGLGFNALFTSSFELNGRVIYSPIAQGEATDNHYLRNLVTEDEADDMTMLAFELAGIWSFTENLGLEGSFSYVDYDTTQGDSTWYFNDQGVVVTLNDGAGMDHSSTLMSLSLRYTF